MAFSVRSHRVRVTQPGRLENAFLDPRRRRPVTRAQPAIPIGLPILVKMAFDGADLTSVWNTLVDRINNDPYDAAALIDLSTIAHIQGRPGDRIALQNAALELQRVYRQLPKYPLRMASDC